MDGHVDVWDFDADRRSAQRLVWIHWPNEGINAVEFSPDGQEILSASKTAGVKAN